MAALTADRDTYQEVGLRRSYQVKASTKIYAGSIVCIAAATGYAEPGADTVGLVFVGIAVDQADNSSGAAGAISVEVECSAGRVAALAAAGLALGDITDQLYISDDQTVAKSTTNSIKIGRLAYFESATVAPVQIEPLVA